MAKNSGFVSGNIGDKSNEDIVDELLREELGDLELNPVGNEVKSNAECGESNVECGESTLECGETNVECGKSNAECGESSNEWEGDRAAVSDEEVEPDEYVIDETYLMEEEKEMSEDELNRRYSDSCELKQSGNTEFRTCEYVAACQLYTQALKICPLRNKHERAILYANRAACLGKMEKKEKAISDCTKAVELDPQYVKALMRRARLYEDTDKLDEALEDYKAVLEVDGSVHEARAACLKLPAQINERNERLKTEMMGKLRDLGNMVLRPFGLSTNNFQVQQDPNTGSYSINFQQKPPPNNGK